jgi:hypothetical protein
MKKLTISDISKETLIPVRNKWIVTLQTHRIHWQRCAMCEEVNAKVDENCGLDEGETDCDYCPLFENDWCTSETGSSRIHKRHHRNSKDWEEELNNFINWLDLEIECRGERE